MERPVTVAAPGMIPRLRDCSGKYRRFQVQGKRPGGWFSLRGRPSGSLV